MAQTSRPRLAVVGCGAVAELAQFLPIDDEIRRDESHGRVRIDEAAELLGSPRFSFPEGMDLTSRYLRSAFTSTR